MGEFGIGQPVRRFEDKRLLRGNGRFQNDNNLFGQLHAYVLRSPYAHARIRALDLAAAKAAPGVALIMTGDDLVAAKLGIMGIPFQRKRPDGSPMFARAHLGLAQGSVRYVGEPVAFVVIDFAVGADGGDFAVAGTDRRISLADVAKASFQAGRLPPGLESGLYETGTFAPDDNTYPNGCHVCEVEIDRDTGALEIVRYVVIDDVGTVVNPIGLKGQIHGGVAQGLGQALMEAVVYDRETGQNLTGSFMDYPMPRADTMPDMEITSNPVPTKRNPLGAKGAGEAGTVGALPAIVNAVVDALSPLGVKGLDMPATSARIWQAMRHARA